MSSILDSVDIPPSREETVMLLDSLYREGPQEIRSMLSRAPGGRFIGTMLVVSAVNVSGPEGGDLLEELEEDLEPLSSLKDVEVLYAGFVFERYDIPDISGTW